MAWDFRQQSPTVPSSLIIRTPAGPFEVHGK
jgi:hypothetical protein